MSDKCAYCTDGLVVVQGPTDAYAEAYGPCPKCEAGHLVEYPAPDAKGRQKPGPWGENGYWRGRDKSFLEPRLDVPLPYAENQRRAQAFLASLNGVTREME